MGAAEAEGDPRTGLPIHARALGTPMQNAFAESFIGRRRDECLNEPLFCGLGDARRLIEAWRIDYTFRRPHTSLGGLTPGEFATQSRSDHTMNRTNF